jgi:phosphoadenosine phosphosulfate reductase
MSRTNTTELRRRAELAATELEGASATDVIDWTAKTFGNRCIAASNMQDGVLTHLVTRAGPGIGVVFLDTGYHFAETIGTRDAISAVPGVDVINLLPAATVAEQDAAEGEDLFARDPNRCCHLRKVLPLEGFLANYDAWITGIRRVESPTRAAAPLIGFDDTFGLVKINPIVAWTDEDMRNYIETHAIIVNPLVEEGYPSIGCAPCTDRPAPGADARSGRWSGTGKTECGLHA